MQFFFVCGAPKSGTTWLQKIMDAHPDVVCSGEGHFIESIAAPAAKLIKDYNARMRHVDKIVYQGTGTYGTVKESETIEWTRTFIMQRMQRRAGPGTRAVGDKTPSYARALSDLNYLFPQCRIFHIVRDPRDVVVSTRYHGVRSGLKEALVPNTEHAWQVIKAGTGNWKRTMQCVDAFTAKHPGRLVEVRYEDLLADPLPNLRRLFAGLDIELDATAVEDIARQTSFENLSGRPRGVQDEASFFRKGVAGDWQSGLTDEELAFVVSQCGAHMRARHYV